MGVGAAYMIMFFYSCVATGYISIFLRQFKGDFVGITMETAKAQFGSVIMGPLSPIVWQVIVMTVVAGILAMGVKQGVRKLPRH